MFYGFATQPTSYDSQIQTRPRFLYNAPTPKFHHPMFTRSEVIVLTNKHTHKQAKRRRWKHPTLFTTLRRWVKMLPTYFKIKNTVAYLTSNVTGHHQGPKQKLRGWCCMRSTFSQHCRSIYTMVLCWQHYIVHKCTTVYYVANSTFHRRVWYRALSLHCACIRHSGIILIL